MNMGTNGSISACAIVRKKNAMGYCSNRSFLREMSTETLLRLVIGRVPIRLDKNDPFKAKQ